ncbi:hypothetical protein Rhow_008036 [Rhodococcus wratislaviensis]|uniref:Uncharacterized protein n=1 Tax=Rhodococcus wratislaviensis TaxID=44752 RepID=A0A402CJJ5_RHOWR|nr:hypothetical protein Rhow_008036 [Rhodococcus wratislaviensis]
MFPVPESFITFLSPSVVTTSGIAAVRELESTSHRMTPIPISGPNARAAKSRVLSAAEIGTRYRVHPRGM